MLNKLEKYIENIVDNTDSKKVDILAIGIMIITSVITLYLFSTSLNIIRTPILEKHSWWIYSILFLFTVALFYLTMLGDKTQKPVNRPKIFLFTTIVMSVNTYCLLAEVFNYIITSIIDSIIKVVDVPSYLIQTNVRFITVFLPLLIVILVYSKSFQIPFKKEYKNQILEYEIDLLTKNVDPITEYSVDLKLCEDIETGKDVIVSEKISYRHKLIGGSSGSGKTALSIRPDLSQLFYKKAKFREDLKKLTYQALEEGLCYINKPITNKYFNDNFSMDLISIRENKREDFMDMFKDYIVGIRDSNRRLYSQKHTFNKNDAILIDIPYTSTATKTILKVKINVYITNMIKEEINIDIDTNNILKTLDFKDYSINICQKPYTTEKLDADNEPYEEVIEKEINGILYTDYIEFTIKSKNNEKSSIYLFDISLDEQGEGKIIYRNLGVAVVAPDGGLSEDTVEIAADNGIVVNKIDPKMDEIHKGHIAQINPMLVGSPEKAADIISSILVAMEQTSGKDNNSYFTNASIRAIRNIVILLRVTYPATHDNKNPILTDVLDRLNNFSLVQAEVEFLEQDSSLALRWKSVIDYFKTSFYPQPLSANGKPIPGESIGSKTKKTEEAITGVINQLDNFLGREELRYIFCDRDNSLDLAVVLEKGDCLAISTRQSELGEVLGKAFALMIILSIQNAVLGRFSEDENPEIPFFLFIDEFPFYVNDQTKVFFTFARKYKTSVTCAIQNLAQLEEVTSVFRQVILTNCTTKLILPGSNVEDREYYGKLFGMEETLDVQTSVTSNPVISENAQYSEGARGTLTEKNKVSEQDLAELKFKRCFYTTVSPKGNTIVGKGVLDFLKLTNENTIKSKLYNFEKFNSLSKKIRTAKNDELINLAKSNLISNTKSQATPSVVTSPVTSTKNTNAADDELKLKSDIANFFNADAMDDIDDNDFEIDVSLDLGSENKASTEAITQPSVNLLNQDPISYSNDIEIEEFEEFEDLITSSENSNISVEENLDETLIEIDSDFNESLDNTINLPNNISEDTPNDINVINTNLDSIFEFNADEVAFEIEDTCISIEPNPTSIQDTEFDSSESKIEVLDNIDELETESNYLKSQNASNTVPIHSEDNNVTNENLIPTMVTNPVESLIVDDTEDDDFPQFVSTYKKEITDYDDYDELDQTNKL